MGIISSFSLSNEDDDRLIEEPTNPQEFTHSLGEKTTFDGFEVAIDSFRYDASFCGIQPSESTDDILLIVSVTLYNPTDKTIELRYGSGVFGGSNYNYTLVFNESIKYNETYKKYNDFLITHDEIKPLQTIKASLCYIVPKQVKEQNNKSLIVKFSKNQKDTLIYHNWILRS